jgi:hypothetical protein
LVDMVEGLRVEAVVDYGVTVVATSEEIEALELLVGRARDRAVPATRSSALRRNGWPTGRGLDRLDHVHEALFIFSLHIQRPSAFSHSQYQCSESL